MYLPYLRGKQYELLALRESIDFLSDSLVPIIEPVKSNFVSLQKAIKTLNTNNKNSVLIANPNIGELKSNHTPLLELVIENPELFEKTTLAFLLTSPSDIPYTLDTLENYNFQQPIVLIHKYLFNEDEKAIINQIPNVSFNLIDFDRTSRRYHRGFNNIISIDDHFKKQRTNEEYSKSIDESFSEEHLFFNDDGFMGFSDFLTIGEGYVESGFLPYAVAIHLTYLDSNNVLRVRHFVSDTNDDNSNVAGKYFEAVTKLIEFKNQINLNTRAANEYQDLYDRQHYPGLGILKKLSILNHLELVSSIIQ